MQTTDVPPPELVSLLRAVRTLLALTACLLALLVLGLGVGAWYTATRLGHLEAAARAQAGAWQGLLGDLGQQATRRQGALSTGMVETSLAARTRLAALSERRRGLSGHPPDPFAKLDRVIDLNALMADELLLLLRHSIDSQVTLGRGLRPLPGVEPPKTPGSAP